MFESQGRLMVQGAGQPAIAAEVVGANRAAIAAVGAQLLFSRNSEGQVLGPVLNQNGQQMRGSKR